ncbi:MAG: hypothetical protein M3Q08_06585 [Pseudomonadota bacterium]|nr:hypothetical protein [Pseudomonadota bacterium]
MSLPFFAEMLVKSAVIALIGLLLGWLLKSRSAADRAAVLRLAIGLILLLPVISWYSPALQLEIAAPAQMEAPDGAPAAERRTGWPRR